MEEALTTTHVADASATHAERNVLRFELVLAVAVVLLVSLYCHQTVADPDIWWHLNNAEKFLATGHFPHTDVYSFTAYGMPWMSHEWLAEMPYYFAWRAFGLRGLYAMLLAVAGSVLLGIFYLCVRASGDLKNSFIVTAFAVPLTAVSFAPRTLLFGWLFLVLLLVILDRFRHGDEQWIWAVPPLFCVWINTHGSWLIGLVIFAIHIATGQIRFNAGIIESERWTPAQFRKLCIVLAASIALLFVNPYGYRLVQYPFDLAFHQKLNVGAVEEWASVDFHTARGKLMLVFLAAFAGSALVSRKTWKLHEVVLVVLALYASLTYVRFLFLAAILISPLLAQRLRLFSAHRKESNRPLLNAVMLSALLFVFVTRLPSEAALQRNVDTKFPAGALAHLHQQETPGRMLNLYSWGGYLQRFNPTAPVFIDPRADIFEYKGVLKDYLDITGVKNSLSLLDRYDIDHVLMPPGEALSYLLRNNPGWRIEYEDNTSVLFGRVH